jgi:hypothetical protein
MNINELKLNNWTITEKLHEEEGYYYFIAVKDRYILTSKDGITFNGLINGRWI